MKVKGGALEFDIVADNEQIKKALEEVERRVTGVSDAMVGAGDTIDDVSQDIVNSIEVQKKVIEELEENVRELDIQMNKLGPGPGQQEMIDQAKRVREELDNEKQALSLLEEELKKAVSTTISFGDAFEDAEKAINKAFEDIDAMAEMHNTAIRSLEKQYKDLGDAAATAFMKGTDKGDDEYRALSKKQQVVSQELQSRRELLKEIEATADALLKEEVRLNEAKEATEKKNNAYVSLRSQLMKIREELVMMETTGERATNPERYKELEQEAGRLAGAISNVNRQTQLLGHNQATLQGVISAVSGISGAFSAAQGAVGLFAGKNEDLQKIMVKVQSLMAITIGLQQVSQTLHEKSAFSLKILGGIKQWWADVLTKANVVETSNTIATKANTTATTANAIATTGQAVATKTGTLANIGLAGSFRLIGVAIKSIPVMGWIIAGISAIVSVVSVFSSKAREAKKEAKEFNEEVAKMAGKPVSSINQLAIAWNKLGNDIKAKEKFIIEHASKFDELGVAIKNVEEAENLLQNNTDAFVRSEIEKAKAMATRAKAASFIEELIQNEEKLEAARAKPKVTRFVGGGMFGGGGTYEIDNPEIAKYEKLAIDLETKIKDAYNIAADQDAESKKALEDAEIKTTQEYSEGSIGALEEAISKKREILKELSDPEEYKNAIKEIESLQKDISNITGDTNKGSTAKKTDPYIEMLEERKKQYTQYYKWANSNDEILQKAAKTEFASLLEEGSSYLDYLNKQRDELLALSSTSPDQAEKLKKLNNEIANETKDTVLGEFENELKRQLDGAHSIMEMLNILEEKRKTLSSDGSDVDEGKTKIIDDAQEDIAKKAEDETKSLLTQYAGYLEKKIEFDVNYLERKRLLTEASNKATTDEERKIAQAALSALEEDKKRYAKSSGNEEYDNLLQEYRSFEQKKADISSEFDEKIALATEQKNNELVEKLTEAKNKALSSAALEELQSSGVWDKLFSNLDDLTTKQIEQLISKVEAQRLQLGIELDPKDLETILSKLDQAKTEIRDRNPFKALIEGVKDYGKATDDEAKKKGLTEMFKGLSGSIDLVGGAFDTVVDGLVDMGIAGDETTQQLLGDISQMIGSAGELASGIATGNPLSIIQGSIGLITSAFKVFNTQDRQAERSIARHAEAIKGLESAYNDLSREVDRALGTKVYDKQQALVRNLQKQQEHLNAMRRAEEGKKKTDKDKLNEYNEQIKNLGNEIEDVIDDIAYSITQTTAKDLSNQLADALVEAFSKGEDAAEAFEEVTNKVMQNAVKNALKLQFLEQPLQEAVKQLQKDMGFDANGGGGFDGLTPQEQQKFKDHVARIGSDFAEAMKAYEGLFKDIDSSVSDPTTTLSGALKGASQESIDLLAGQTNAVRVNQVESMDIMRNQLLHLVSIDAKVGVSNSYLESIDNKLSSNNSSDPLRSQGIDF